MRGFPVLQYHPLGIKLGAAFSNDVEKFRAIYTWVCQNIESDYALSVEYGRMRDKYVSNPAEWKKWNKKFSKRVFQKMQTENRTICTGYVWLVSQMALAAGIECRIVDGYGRTSKVNTRIPGVPNHSWNAVKLNGKWYLCDPTWSSGSIDGTSKEAIQRYDDAYFLAEPSQFIRDHYPLDTAWILMGEKPTLQKFLSRPITYRAAYRYGVNPITPDSLELTARRRAPFTLALISESNVAAQSVKMLINPNSVDISPIQRESGEFVFTHTFISRGRYDLHVIIGADYVLTYTVRVK